MDELLRLSNIQFWYEEKYPTLIDVSVKICAGERIAVLGGNGAGKSTFFLCCNGVLMPRDGRIFLKGQEIKNVKSDIKLLRQTVGLVFQDPDNQIVAGTVEGEVSFGPMNLKLPKSLVAKRVEQSLKKVNLDGFQSRAPHYLSGGEKKRVSIADILAMEPEIILFDEPTASLDPENVEVLFQTLEDLSNAGVTLLVSTHDVEFAYRFATRAIVFSHGKIIADGDVNEIFANDAALTEAGLKKPLFYAVTEIIENYFPETSIEKKPRTIEEFNSFIESFSSSKTLGLCPKPRKGAAP